MLTLWFSDWFSGLPLVRSFNLMRSARSSFQWLCTFIIVATNGLGLWLGPRAHVFNLALVALFVTITLIPYLSWLVGKSCVETGVRLSHNAIARPQFPQATWRRIVAAIPDLIFILWGVYYMLGHFSRRLNLIVFVIWTVYFTVGNVIGIFKAFQEWRVSQKVQST